MSHSPSAQAIATALGIGSVETVEVVKPGSVPVWKVATTTGMYHCKLLNSDTAAWRDQAIAGAAEIEWAAVAAGVDMPEPIALGKWIGDRRVTVHRWHEGLRPVTVDDDLASWLGATMVRLHQIPVPSALPSDSLAAAYGLQESADWDEWIDAACSEGLRWASAAVEARDIIATTDAVVRRALTSTADRCGSHRDLHAGNILAGAGAFLLVDWDYAGAEVPWLEAVRASMEYARADGRTDPEVGRVAAVLSSYQRAGGAVGPGGDSGMAAILGIGLSRIAYFMWVSLGHRNAMNEERAWATDYLVTAPGKLAWRRRWATVLDDALARL